MLALALALASLAPVSCGGAEAAGPAPGGPPGPTKATLRVHFTGLPAGTAASGIINAPGITDLHFGHDTTFVGAPGNYGVQAQQVIVGTTTYNSTPGASGVGLAAGDTLTMTFVYSAVAVAPASKRATADRTDDLAGAQIHVIYALPSDGSDQGLDTNGTLVATVGSWQNWLSGQTSGRSFRIDTYQGALDITFVRLGRSNSTMSGYGAFIRDTIEKDLKASGLVVAGQKIYAVYYDGGSNYSCGGGSWPPTLPGQVGAMYLQGTPPGSPSCASNGLAATPTSPPGYLEFAMIHEMMHTLGFVSTAAPHHTLSGHASDSNTDLMYAGAQPWFPSTLDVGKDDYFNASGLPAGVLNLANSPYLQP